VSSEQIWLAAGGAVALLLLVVVLALAGAVRRLASRVSALEAAGAPTPATAGATSAPEPAQREQPAASYVITALDRDDDLEPSTPVQGRIDGALFADIVAREGVIKAAGLAHGLRRALAPETRNRIRFEMRREVKRSRRQRRVDLKAALRDMQARERAQMADQRDEGDAA
jgi:hypothetical protein